MTVLRITVLIIIATFHFGVAAAKQNEYFPDGGHGGDCIFNGDISKSDVPRFKDNLAKGCRRLFLKSNGGDVDAAIAMGAAIRNRELRVIVLEKAFCRSSCVFLYAGGVIRLPYSQIEIHRPYLPSSGASFEATQKKYQEVELKIKAYLRTVNVSERLFDMMMKVPPHEMQSLDLEEMTNLGMGQRDPVYNEYLDNKRAARSGLTKQEWLVRKLASQRICGDIEALIQPGKSEEILSCWKKEFPEFMRPMD